MLKRIKAKFRGNVQGIGFRALIYNEAKKLNVVGWVKNNEDGTVSLVAEGKEKILDKLMKFIQDKFKNNIEDMDVIKVPAQEEFEDFEIIY